MLPRSPGGRFIFAWTVFLVTGAAAVLWDYWGATNDGIHSMRITERSPYVSGGGHNGPLLHNWDISFQRDDGRIFRFDTRDGSRESSILTVGTTWKATVWRCRLHDAVCRISEAVEQRPPV